MAKKCLGRDAKFDIKVTVVLFHPLEAFALSLI